MTTLYRLLAIVFVLTTVTNVQATPPKQQFYQIKVYHFKTDAQEKSIDNYLQQAFIPAMHRLGVNNIGVFKPIEKDTADLRIYVLVPLSGLDQIVTLEGKLNTDKQYLSAGKEYLDAPYSSPSFMRVESILLKAFSHQPVMNAPALKGSRTERVYELRSYEGHTEKIFTNKVHMFNEGGEIALFKRLNFNAVFYAEVIAGSRMPNLMYMTTFENKADRDSHWKTFVDDPEWKKLSGMPEYQHNVSHMDIHLVRPTDYSDY